MSFRVLVQSDTYNGDTTFVDNSPDERSITVVGDSKHVTTYGSPFSGISSAIFLDNTGRLSFSNHNIASELTIDTFFYGSASLGSVVTPFRIGYDGSAADGTSFAVFNSGTVSGFFGNTTSIYINKGTTRYGWHHLAITWDGTYLYVFLNGVLWHFVMRTTYPTGVTSVLGEIKGNNSGVITHYPTVLSNFAIRDTCIWSGSGYSIDDTVFTPPTEPYSIGVTETENRFAANFQRDIIYLYNHWDASPAVNSQTATFTDYPVTVETGTSVDVEVGFSTFSFAAPELLFVVGDAHTAVSADTFSFTGYPATVSAEQNAFVTVESDTFSFTGYPATVSAGVSVDVGEAWLIFVNPGVGVEANEDISVSVPASPFHFTGYPVAVTGDVSVSADSQTFAFTGYAVTARVDVSQGADVQHLTFGNPGVSVETAEATSVSVTFQELAFISHEVSVIGIVNAEAEYSVFSFTSLPVEAQTDSFIPVDYSGLSFIDYPAEVDLTQGVNISADVFPLVFSGFPVSVSTVQNVFAAVEAGTLTFSDFPVSATVSAAISAEASLLAFTGFPVSALADFSALAESQTMTFTGFPVTVETADAPEIHAGVSFLHFTGYPATVRAEAVVTIPEQTLFFSDPLAEVSAGIGVSVAMQGMVFSGYPVSVSGDANISTVIHGLAFTSFPIAQAGEILFVPGLMHLEAEAIKPWMEAAVLRPSMQTAVKKPFMTGDIQ